MTSGNWYALTVRPQHEFKVAQGLALIGEQPPAGFVPTYKDKRTWSDRTKILDVPLFAGYVFARFDHTAARGHVVRLPGVRSIVGFGGIPAPIREEEIESIRKLVDSGFPLQPWPFLKTGQRVRVDQGPLKGVEGLIVGRKDEWLMVVSVELLQRSIAVSLDRSVLKPVKQAAGKAVPCGRSGRAGAPVGKALSRVA
jgi:transcription antitermination factor NusG